MLAREERDDFVFPGSTAGEAFEVGVVVVWVEGEGGGEEGLEG